MKISDNEGRHCSMVRPVFAEGNVRCLQVTGLPLNYSPSDGAYTLS